MRVWNETRGTVLVEQGRVARTFWSRGKGLLGTKSLPSGQGLLIEKCSSIHSFGMQYPFDALFLDRDGRVVHRVERMKQNRMSRHVWSAKAVLELPAGMVSASGTLMGDAICWETARRAARGMSTPDLALAAPSWRRIGLRWAELLTDHVVPGVAFSLATIGNVFLLSEIWMGAGPAAGLDATTQAWLFAQRAIYTVFVGLIAVLFVIRRRRMGGQIGLVAAAIAVIFQPQNLELRREVRTRLVPAVVALLGTNAMALQAFFPVHETALAVTIPGVALGAFGLLLAAAALASLGRCFGIFPEVRGLVQHGPYRMVRHPLYLAEIIASIGGILTALSPYSILVFVVFVGLQFKRATYEEQVLAETFPGYREYARHTWRLIPGVH